MELLVVHVVGAVLPPVAEAEVVMKPNHPTEDLDGNEQIVGASLVQAADVAIEAGDLDAVSALRLELPHALPRRVGCFSQ